MKELIPLVVRTLMALRLRSALSILGIAVGVASVVLLTSIGEGTRRFILSEFTQFGTNLLSVLPGKTETTGIPGIFGGTTRPLTLEDAAALERLPGVVGVVPVAYGNAEVEGGGKTRRVLVYGVTPKVEQVWRFRVSQGSFWGEGGSSASPPVAVLGQALARELFGKESPLGRTVRVGGVRLRVSGLMAPKGTMLGIDLDDVAYIPVARALELFNLPELNEIHLEFAHAGLLPLVEQEVRRVLTLRHGEEDFTVVSQAAMLEVFDNVMGVITLAVGAIGGISLLVGAIGVLTMMWIAVSERKAEIGLLRACGVSRSQVQQLFLVEAAVLGVLGGVVGLLGGLGIAGFLRLLLPGLPVAVSPEFSVAGLLLSLATGLAAGYLPSQRAARLDPIAALRAE
jgi:putative ABC transport system permease protein